MKHNEILNPATSPTQLRALGPFLTALAAWGLTLVAWQNANAQTYSIDWYKVAGGGGTSTGGVYSVSGTVGQAEAGGPMAGGKYSVTGGFWSIIATVATPGAPRLSITRSGNSVIISWPSPSTGFALQQNNSVANAVGWSNFTGTVNDDGTTKSITVNPQGGGLFFRLKQ
jgi:hypothetical protein